MDGKDKAMAKEVEDTQEETTETGSEKLNYISFVYEGSTFTLEYNRETIELLERHFGVNIAKMLDGNIEITALPVMFLCALKMHHPKIKQSTVNKLYDLMDNKMDLYLALLELISNGINETFASSDEGNAISWSRH